MKKIVASVGLVALTTGINPVFAQDATATPPYKPWNVSATLRGFYDDNINTVPTDNPNHVGSTGFQFNPAVNLNWSNDQTMASLGYIYTFRYYDKQPLGNDNHYDQDQQFTAVLNHSFTERYSASVKDSFILGQEPDMLRAAYGSAGLSDFQRVSGNNIVNSGVINFNAQMTPVFGLAAGFGNDYFNYEDSGAQNIPGLGVGEITSGGIFIPGPSNSGLLDRSDSRVNVDGRWQLQPETVGVVGYMFENVSYLSDEPIATQGGSTNGASIFADSRNIHEHYFYVGADQNFRPDLSGSVRVGARYSNFYNNNSTQWNPYLLANLQYNYAVESSVQIGFSYNNTATDEVSPAAGTNNNIVLDANAFVFTASVNQRIVPNLYGSLVGQFQNSTFNGGSIDGDKQQYWLLGLNFMYRFNPYLSADAGYNFDQLVSPDIPGQAFVRNRFYIGVTGSY
jgi:hypothetical protein